MTRTYQLMSRAISAWAAPICDRSTPGMSVSCSVSAFELTQTDGSFRGALAKLR
jgi:hypothetical protein